MDDQNIESPVQPDLTKIRDNICKPIALEVLKAIAEEGDKLAIGSTATETELLAYYNTLYESKIAPIIMAHADTLRVIDVDFVFKIAMQAIELVRDRVNATFDVRYNQALAKQFEVKDIDDLTVKALDNVLTK